jgi:general stress protein 26
MMHLPHLALSIYNMSMGKQAIFDFITHKEEKLCVLATATRLGIPECAVVGFAAKDDGVILINTNKNSRKIANIRENSKVALAIGWNFDERNFQYEGMAEVIERDNPAFADCEQFFFTANPGAEKFKSPDTIFIRVTPTWVRMIDLTQSPPATEELAI